MNWKSDCTIVYPWIKNTFCCPAWRRHYSHYLALSSHSNQKLLNYESISLGHCFSSRKLKNLACPGSLTDRKWQSNEIILPLFLFFFLDEDSSCVSGMYLCWSLIELGTGMLRWLPNHYFAACRHAWLCLSVMLTIRPCCTLLANCRSGNRVLYGNYGKFFVICAQ